MIRISPRKVVSRVGKRNTCNLYRKTVELELRKDRQIGGSIYWQRPNDTGFTFFPDAEIVSSEATLSARNVVKEIFLFNEQRKFNFLDIADRLYREFHLRGQMTVWRAEKLAIL